VVATAPVTSKIIHHFVSKLVTGFEYREVVFKKRKISVVKPKSRLFIILAYEQYRALQTSMLSAGAYSRLG